MKNVKSIDKTYALPGTYLLLFHNRINQAIEIGKIGTMEVQQGYYLYVGSAFGSGGIKARVNRHIRQDKTLKWHIDYLRSHCCLERVFINYSANKQESNWVEKLQQQSSFSTGFNGFGASDSHHSSHLFFSPSLPTNRKISHTLKTKDLTCLEINK